jgi:hypothetical protein
LNVFPRQTQALPATLNAGLFSSQTATTVPARSAVLATQTGVTELTSAGGYGRASITNATWPAPASSGSGMRTTVAANGVVFGESTAAFSAPVNGFFISPTAAIGAGIALFYSNFSDDTAITVNAAGFTIRLAPYIHFDG